MKYNLNESIKENLNSLGYKDFTNIQEKVIPLAIEGKDIIGKSQTGTGKTAAFLIPIIEKVKAGESFQCLVLTPTRELAIQVKEEAEKISKNMKISVCSIYGGERIENQISILRNRKPEIIVGTPGRVIDHMKRRTLTFQNIKFFVLDEVDEMVNRGFIDDIKLVGREVKNSSSNLQTLLFSATISEETKKILNEFTNENRVFISSDEQSSASSSLISQYYMPIDDRTTRIESLIDIIFFQNPELAIVFASTKKLVDIISDELTNQGFLVEKIHSDLSQKQRTEVYNKLKTGKIRFLIATDIAARGIDVEGVSHVYNYDFPQDPQFYIHRIGRTGRAGAKGESLIILKKWERNKLFQIERITGSTINPIYKPSKEQIEEIIKNQVIEKVEKQIISCESIETDFPIENILKRYKPESIVKALVKTFSIKKKKIEHSEEGERQRFGGNSRRRFGSSNSNNRRSNNFSNKSKKKRFNY